MPRKTKEDAKNVEKETKPISKVNKSKNTTKKATKKASTSKVKKETKTTAKKTTTKKATTKSTTKKVATKKKNVKDSVEILEYYDLPYSYNQTVVKVLAQTPTTLFVYWDISDEDKNKYIEQYGTYFFNNTKPVLIVHNITKNYNFEIDINDFANSWYLHIPDSNCDYKVELGRRPINEYVSISNDYLFVASSNEMDAPNDRILFDSLSNIVYFRNVKNNRVKEKNIATLSFIRNIGKFYSVKDFYKKLYSNEKIDFDKLDLDNPSSNNPTSSFK